MTATISDSEGRRFRLSRFAHFVEGEDGHVAVLNALNLAVVVVDANTAARMRHRATCHLEPRLAAALERERLLVPANSSQDLDDLAIARQHLDHSPVGILYLLLHDRCNISCRYCYVENAMPRAYRHAAMTEATALKAVDLFSRVVSASRGLDEPQIILYGGEPLLNWPVALRVLEYVDDLRASHALPASTSVTLNTNAMLVTDEVARGLANHPQLTVAVSVDGPKEVHDSFRVDSRGHGTLERVDEGIRLLKEAGVSVGLCCTLAAHNVDKAEVVLEWLTERYGVKALGFNTLIGPSEGLAGDDYADKVASKLIACFQWARTHGIYEDRIMRKVRSFVEGRMYMYDCGGCGQQIVVAPDGQVGVCQAYCGSRQYFEPLTQDFDPVEHPTWREWRRRSPIGMEQCVDCIALGNCGGGCPYAAERAHGTIWGLDEGFCVFSRRVIEFLVRDLVKSSVHLAAHTSS